jgi:hypothetical protein
VDVGVCAGDVVVVVGPAVVVVGDVVAVVPVVAVVGVVVVVAGEVVVAVDVVSLPVVPVILCASTCADMNSIAGPPDAGVPRQPVRPNRAISSIIDPRDSNFFISIFPFCYDVVPALLPPRPPGLISSIRVLPIIVFQGQKNLLNDRVNFRFPDKSLIFMVSGHECLRNQYLCVILF